MKTIMHYYNKQKQQQKYDNNKNIDKKVTVYKIHE